MLWLVCNYHYTRSTTSTHNLPSPCHITGLLAISFPIMPLPARKSKKKKAAIPVLRGTFTAEEVTKLLEWLPRYMQLKRLLGKKFTDFWEPLWEEWFAAFPLKPLTQEQILAGIDQGDRKGERLQMVKQVSKIVTTFSQQFDLGTFILESS